MPGIKQQRGSVFRAYPAVARKLGLPLRNPRTLLEKALGLLDEPFQLSRQVRCAGNLLSAGFDFFSDYHVRTPFPFHSTGRTVAPRRSAVSLARAGWSLSRNRKNMHPPAPAPAAFPPSAPNSVMAASRRAISLVHIDGSSTCCSSQLRWIKIPTSSQSPRFMASAISVAASFNPRNASTTLDSLRS